MNIYCIYIYLYNRLLVKVQLYKLKLYPMGVYSLHYTYLYTNEKIKYKSKTIYSIYVSHSTSVYTGPIEIIDV